MVSDKGILLADVLEVFQLESSVLAFELEIVFFGFGHEFEHEVKDVKVSFAGRLADDAAFLQEVVSDG